MVIGVEFLKEWVGPGWRHSSPALALTTDTLPWKLVGVQNYSGAIRGKKILSGLRGFEDATPWMPMSFHPERFLTKHEMNDSAAAEDWLYYVSFSVKFVEFQSQWQMDITPYWNRRVESRGRYYSMLYPIGSGTQSAVGRQAKTIESQVESELRLARDIILDPNWWWAKKYAEETVRQEEWQVKIDKSSLVSVKAEQEIQKRQGLMPV